MRAPGVASLCESPDAPLSLRCEAGLPLDASFAGSVNKSGVSEVATQGLFLCAKRDPPKGRRSAYSRRMHQCEAGLRVGRLFLLKRHVKMDALVWVQHSPSLYPQMKSIVCIDKALWTRANWVTPGSHSLRHAFCLWCHHDGATPTGWWDIGCLLFVRDLKNFADCMRPALRVPLLV